MIRHFGFRLGAEILDDDFLDMAVGCVQVGDGVQGVEAFGAGFADADQDPRGEGNAQNAC